MLIYVDNIILTGTNSRVLTELISNLSTEFALKDLGDLHFFLGIEKFNIPLNEFISHSQSILRRYSKKQKWRRPPVRDAL